jgi:hypothetical protein
MTWADVKKTLTTPPPPRPPPPKPPLFTKDFFSTTSFGPGQLVGAGVLVFALYGITKFVIARGRAQAEETRRLADQGRPPPRRPEDETQLAQAPNQRGEYGKKP